MKNKLARLDFIRMLTAIGISLVIVFAIIFLVSKDPMNAIESFVLGPLSTVRRRGNVIELMIPLMFAGLSIIFLFKTGLFNLSAEGAIFAGAVAAAITTLNLNAPPLVNLVVSIVAAGILGSVITFIPGFLKVKFNANEIVTSLMLNFVCLNIGLYFIHGFYLDPTINSNYSYKFPVGVELPRIVAGTRIHVGLIISLIVVAISYVVLNKSIFGFKGRLVGSNHKMAEYAGVTATSIILLTQLIGGFVAGMGGAVELFGMYNRFQYGGLTGYGWEGIPIAIIARHNPKNLPFAALFFAYLKIGADIMARQSDVPFEIVQIIQAVMIIFISAEALLAGYRKRTMMKELQKMEQEVTKSV